MEKHKLDAELSSDNSAIKSGYFRIDVRPDHIIFVEPTGYITGNIVEHELERLKQTIADVQAEGHHVFILVNIGKITNHTTESRSAIKKASELPFERGAAYGGSRLLGMIMQYLQRSIDPNRAHYFRTEDEALEYLKGKKPKKRPSYRAASRRFIIISSVLLIFFAAAAVLGWSYSEQQATQESKALFSQKVQQDHSELQKRMDVYIQALYGIRGLFNASQSVERSEFDAYFKSLNLSTEFPGFNAISFVQHVPQAQLSQYAKTVQKDTSFNGTGYPNFAVYPAANKTSYDVVTYVEPVSDGTNLGFDLSSDPVRLQTLASARDSGLPTASASITFSGASAAKGFIVTIPIYKKPLPTTVAERQERLFGYVNAVFQYDTLFKDAFTGLDETNIGVDIYDAQNTRIYDAGKDTADSQTIVNTLTVAGRKLTISFTAPTSYGLSDLAQRAPRTALNSGIFALILLSLLLATLLRSRGQAIKLASTMTIDLEHERNLAIENERKLEVSEKALAEEKASVERKVVERTRELNEVRAQLEASLRGLPFGFAIIDHGHEGVFSNQALSAIVGQDIPIGTATHATLERLHSALKKTIDVAACLRQAETTLQVVDQACMLGTKYLRILFIPITETQGNQKVSVGSVIIIEDVTEQKALERSRDEFFSIASHELRTPLTAIRGNASMILEIFQDEKATAPQLKQMATDIETSSERLIAIVRDFLNVSELEQGKIVVDKTDTDLAQLTSEIAKEFKPLAEKKHLKIVLKKPVAPVHATIDAARVKQIVGNLIRNSLNFTKEGSITITVGVEKDIARLVVTDTGSGIPVEFQHLLFRKFQQANGNILTRESSQSTGLGLYISKLMAELIGGKLYLEKTEVGKGSTFVLELPRSSTK